MAVVAANMAILAFSRLTIGRSGRRSESESQSEVGQRSELARLIHDYGKS